MDDLQCRILTSGTSGTPRPVDLTYGNFLFSAVGSAFNIGVEPEDRWLCCLPLSHVAGLSIILRSVIYGTTAVLMDGFDTDKVASTLVERRHQRALAGPDPADQAAGRRRGPLRSASDPDRRRTGPRGRPAEALDQGATVVQTYGMTETCSQVTTLAPADAGRKLGSAGRPLLTSHVRIEDGEILVQGPTVSRGAIDPDGWLHTGDLGQIDEEGFLYVTGRRSEVIVTGGENVMPAEVEAVLVSHPAVADAAVVGRPDPEWQEAVCALVVLADGAEAGEEQLRDHCAASLARYKVPKRVDFVSSLPRTASGKLLRGQLPEAASR